jgi:hypothetical protein
MGVINSKDDFTDRQGNSCKFHCFIFLLYSMNIFYTANKKWILTILLSLFLSHIIITFNFSFNY